VDYGEYRLTFTVQNQTNYTVQAAPNPVNGRQSFARTPRYGGWLTIDQDGSRNSQARGGTWP
ncbi:MAG: hypothetical protein ACE5I8_12200, partial [Thermodesulfobacteriota bacterium]